MKIIGLIFLCILLVVVGAQVYMYWGRERLAASELETLRAELAKARLEEEKLKADLEYYQNPDNLEKELRARFNYRGKDEKLIVIVPGAAATGTTSTAQ